MQRHWWGASKPKKIISLGLLFLLAQANLGWSIPQFINLQNRLSDADGTPITTETEVEFRIYQGGGATTADAGTVVHKEKEKITPDSTGLYDYLIGSGTPLEGHTLTVNDFDTNQNVFLQINISGQALLPRIRLTGQPFAFLAVLAETVKPNSITTDSIVNNTIKDEDIASGAAITDSKINFDNTKHLTTTVEKNNFNTLTGGGITTLHQHSGLSPGAHESTHRFGQSDAISGNIYDQADVIRSSHVLNGTLTGDDISNGTVTRDDVSLTTFESNGFGFVPQGAVLPFIGVGACPGGYTEVLSLRNRVLIGADIGGLDGDVPDTVGQNVGDKNPSHAHLHSISHTHTFGSNGPSTASTSSENSGTTTTNGNHQHTTSSLDSGSSNVNLAGGASPIALNPHAHTTSTNGDHSHGNNSHSHTLSAHTHSGTTNDSGSSNTGGISSSPAVHLPPAVTAIWCSKN